MNFQDEKIYDITIIGGRTDWIVCGILCWDEEFFSENYREFTSIRRTISCFIS